MDLINRNYLVFYLNTIWDKIASSLMNIFTWVFFYSMWMPIHFILLFYWLEFWLRWVFSPLGSILPTKIWVKLSLLISYLILIPYFTLVSFAETNLYLAFFAFIFQSAARWIFYPCTAYLKTILVEEKHRWRQRSIEQVIATLSTIIWISLWTFVLANYSYSVLAIIVWIIIFLTWNTFFLLKISKDKPKEENNKYIDNYKFLSSEEFRPNLLALTGQSLTIISTILLPLFIYIIIWDIKTFWIILWASLIIEMLFTYFFWKKLDKNLHSESISLSSKALTISNLLSLSLFIIKSPYYIIFLNLYNKISWNIFATSVNTWFHKIAKKSSNPMKFSSWVQMTLCFTEVIFLSIFALIAYFIWVKIFIIMLLWWILWTFLVRKYLKIK